MKLIFCPDCQDVRKLQLAGTVCRCGESWGEYVDNINATIGGKAVPLGINNVALHTAMKHPQQDNWGTRFEAFVIPENAPTIKREPDGQPP